MYLHTIPKTNFIGQGFQKFEHYRQTHKLQLQLQLQQPTDAAKTLLRRITQMVIKKSGAMPPNPHTGEGYVASPRRLIVQGWTDFGPAVYAVLKRLFSGVKT